LEEPRASNDLADCSLPLRFGTDAGGDVGYLEYTPGTLLLRPLSLRCVEIVNDAHN
jgi:hypothetical protein